MGFFSPSTSAQCVYEYESVSPVASQISHVSTSSVSQENDEDHDVRQQPEQTRQPTQTVASHSVPCMRLNDFPTATLAQRRLSRPSVEPTMAFVSSATASATEVLSPDNLENVVHQTQSIVENYMYIRYQTDMQSEESELSIATPRIPEFQRFTSNPLSATSQVGKQLAKIGDQINSQYQCEFQEMIRHLRITPATAYEAFAAVARRLFTQGINWGRIAALLSFGYQVAISVKAGIGEFISKIIDSIVKFICTERIAKWISEQGGWRAAFNYQLETSESFRLFLAVSVSVAATAGIMYWITHR